MALFDPIHDSTEPHLHWSTANTGEAMPGVLTPLSWSVWGPTTERTNRETFRASGAFTESELPFPLHPDRDDRTMKIFHGRVAVNIEMLAVLGDRMPGTTGADVVRGILGTVPDSLTFAPTRRHYGRVASGLARQNVTIAKRLRAAADATTPWWHQRTERARQMDSIEDCLDLFDEASDRFYQNVYLQTVALFCAVQPMYEAVSRLADKVGIDDIGSLTSGYGGVPETAVIDWIWRCSRQRIGISDIVNHFGFHGPHEGELSSLTWREDDSPLRRMVDQYTARSDSEAPQSDTVERRAGIEAELLAALPRTARAPAKLLLRRAATIIPLRGVAKDAFLQALDVTRSAARRAGELYAASGQMDHPEDVFYLTAPELLPRLAPDAKEQVAFRRARRDEHLTVRLPRHWRGQPTPLPARDPSRIERLEGTGVSPGVVEGVVRVVTDPAFSEVEPGEILVAGTTDPSWASIMFVSSALIVDIGGALSHAAIVAREIGIPCVVNTHHGTESLRTGDRVRVNGSSGLVEVLAD